MTVVYIAGPFRAKDSWQRELNIREAEALALQVWALGGCAVICPHTNTRFFDGALADQIWLEGDLELLRRCDAVLTTPRWRDSSGARAEVKAACGIGTPVFHDLIQLDDWIRAQARAPK